MPKIKTSKKTVPVPVRIPEEWIEKLKALAESHGLSSYSDEIKMAIKQYIDDALEDIVLGQLMQDVDHEVVTLNAFNDVIDKKINKLKNKKIKR